jgi:hypothetical protein
MIESIQTFFGKIRGLRGDRQAIINQTMMWRCTVCGNIFRTKLMNYKRVDCAGPLYHNTPYVITDSKGNLARGDQKYKVEWLSSYKFSVSMENCKSIGYCTEKIIHAMFANCIPIYWGSESVNQDFNENSFSSNILSTPLS